MNLREYLEMRCAEDITEVILENEMDSVYEGFCTNDGCEYTTDVEPDCQKGYCENCDTNTVVSILIAAGMI